MLVTTNIHITAYPPALYHSTQAVSSFLFELMYPNPEQWDPLAVVFFAAAGVRKETKRKK